MFVIVVNWLNCPFSPRRILGDPGVFSSTSSSLQPMLPQRLIITSSMRVVNVSGVEGFQREIEKSKVNSNERAAWSSFNAAQVIWVDSLNKTQYVWWVRAAKPWESNFIDAKQICTCQQWRLLFYFASMCGQFPRLGLDSYFGFDFQSFVLFSVSEKHVFDSVFVIQRSSLSFGIPWLVKDLEDTACSLTASFFFFLVLNDLEELFAGKSSSRLVWIIWFDAVLILSPPFI